MSIHSLLQQYGVKTADASESRHVTSGWLGVVCPYCDRGAGNFGMGINEHTGRVNCWKCGKHNLSEVLHELTGEDERKCRRLAKELAKDYDEDFAARFKRGAGGKLKLPDYLGHLTSAHERFLKSRDFDPKKIERVWGVRGIAWAPEYAWRLYIPITLNGEVVSFTTRKISENNGERKDVHASLEESIVAPKDVLYGADLARWGIIVTEGPLDAWAVGPGGVATLGVQYTKAQVLQMTEFPLRVICFDAEDMAQRQARKLYDELGCYSGKTFNVVLETGKDASRAEDWELERLRSMIA